MSKIEYSEHIKSMHNFRAKELFSKKTPKREAIDFHHFPLVLYVHPKLKSPIFGTKHLLCRRFLQHYYRATQKQINCLRKFEGYTQ